MLPYLLFLKLSIHKHLPLFPIAFLRLLGFHAPVCSLICCLVVGRQILPTKTSSSSFSSISSCCWHDREVRVRESFFPLLVVHYIWELLLLFLCWLTHFSVFRHRVTYSWFYSFQLLSYSQFSEIAELEQWHLLEALLPLSKDTLAATCSELILGLTQVDDILCGFVRVDFIGESFV